MIQVKNLKKRYNGITVLDIEELNIPQGELFGLVGNNGAGKTTFFRLVLDLIEATQGNVFIEGQKAARNESWKSITGSFLDESFLIDFLTPDEYFAFAATLYKCTEDDIEGFLDSMKEIFNDEILGKKKLIRDFSKGNQKKIGIASALLCKPRLLILDEPFTALDPSSQIRLKRFLTHVQKLYNTTMLISSHDLNHVTEICSRIVLLEKGMLVRDIETTKDTLNELESYFSVDVPKE